VHREVLVAIACDRSASILSGSTLPVLAESGGADVHDRMSAVEIAAEEIGHSMAVDRVAIDPKRGDAWLIARLGNFRSHA